MLVKLTQTMSEIETNNSEKKKTHGAKEHNKKQNVKVRQREQQKTALFFCLFFFKLSISIKQMRERLADDNSFTRCPLGQ